MTVVVREKVGEEMAVGSRVVEVYGSGSGDGSGCQAAVS